MYDSTGRKNEAVELAEQIVNKKIKITSPTIFAIQTMNYLMKNKLKILRITTAFLFIVFLSLYVLNPLKKTFSFIFLEIMIILFPVIIIIIERFFRKNEIKQKSLLMLAFIIMDIIYFVI